MNLINAFLKIVILPTCRAYAKHILSDKPADKAMSNLCSIYFWFVHRYWPQLKNPESFSEKILHRMLYNRDDLLTLISDKWLVREYITKKAGSNYLVPLIWHGDKPEDIPFGELPQQFVIKCNHGCGYNILVQNKTQLDIPNTKKLLKKWLNENFCQDKYLGAEWAYKNIKPTIIIEEFIGRNGQVPVDFKFFCYAGRAGFIQVSLDRFSDASEKILDRDFNQIDVWNGVKQYTGKIERPANYESMLTLADTLATDLDFVRVDLYSVGGKIYFGELTCYPAGAAAPFEPKEYDYIFGEKWQIRPH